ncbi:MAG TPA: (Fe-S)-binding protein [Spirochaetota bacterium]|nr:(Fe-S)-binding protein [Spirochaetota bacterium]
MPAKNEASGISRRRLLKTGAAGGMTFFAEGCSPDSNANFRAEAGSLPEKSGTRNGYRTYMDAYHFNECLECGACLAGCPFMELSEGGAAAAIVSLRRENEDEYRDVLDRCVACFKCNHRCPVQAVPAALMLQRLRDRRSSEEVVPKPIRYALNGMADRGWRPNLFRDFYTDLDADEKRALDAWSEPKNCGSGDMLFCGCGTRIFPYDIEHSKVLADLPKFGGAEDCCGLFACRGGLFDQSCFIIERLVARLSQSRFRRLVVACGSCQEMFQVALPHYLGQKFPFRVISLYEYIEERMRAGKAAIQRQVPAEESDACLSDSCHGYEFGGEYLARIERLYRAAGFSCVELEHNRDNNACCGLIGYFNRGTVAGIIKTSTVKRDDIKKSGMKNVLTYCQGCYISSRILGPGRAHYLLEKLLWALGDDIRYPQSAIISRALNFNSIKNMLLLGPGALI